MGVNDISHLSHDSPIEGNIFEEAKNNLDNVEEADIVVNSVVVDEQKIKETREFKAKIVGAMKPPLPECVA